jgi:dihydroxyacetone kinase DhaKLM complex PTS-EIIA-like component DhaM
MVFGFNTFASAAFSDIGTLQFNVEVNVTGQELTIQENAPSVIGDANVSVTGIGFTANLGTAVLDANTLVDLTGQELTMQENAPTVIGDANVTLTENALTANLGTAVLDANTLVDLTGQELTMQEGTATADDASAEITGLSLSMSLGTVKNIMWSEVNTGITQPWTEVDTAA